MGLKKQQASVVFDGTLDRIENVRNKYSTYYRVFVSARDTTVTNSSHQSYFFTLSPRKAVPLLDDQGAYIKGIPLRFKGRPLTNSRVPTFKLNFPVLISVNNKKLTDYCKSFDFQKRLHALGNGVKPTHKLTYIYNMGSQPIMMVDMGQSVGSKTAVIATIDQSKFVDATASYRKGLAVLLRQVKVRDPKLSHVEVVTLRDAFHSMKDALQKLGVNFEVA